MLGSVLGDLLTAAAGVALSPMPVIAVILMLLSARATRLAPAFAIGWTVGVLGVTWLIMAVLPASAAGSGGGSVAAGVIKLGLGLLMLVLAVHIWRGRPKPGQTAALPKWMSGVDTMKPGAALGLGGALAALNPKNLAFLAAGGLALAQITSSGQQAAGLAIFTLVAISSVAGPVLAYLLMRQRVTRPLTELKAWLAEHNTAVMTILLAVLGVALTGKGIGILIS